MPDLDSLPIVVIGGGGHAAVLVDILLSQNRKILAVVSPDDLQERHVFAGLERLRSDDEVKDKYEPGKVKLVNGIGMMPGSVLKKRVNEEYLALGYEFESVIANDALISPFAKIGVGVQIFSGAIVQTDALIEAHSTINSGSIIEHDCIVGAYNHVAPGATLCGNVRTGKSVFIGAGATVIQGVCLGCNSTVAAGVAVLKSLDKQQIIYPAKSTTKTK